MRSVPVLALKEANRATADSHRQGPKMPHATHRFILQPLARYALRLLIATTLIALPLAMARSESPRRLKGAEIRQLFTDKVLTDGTHWKETYAAGGIRL